MGIGRIRFAGDVMADALPLLPRLARIVGSEQSGDGIVILLVENPDLPDGRISDMTLEVQDEGLRRTATLRRT